jgi:hypothetical protein
MPAAGPAKAVVFLPMVSAQERSEYGYQPRVGIAVSAGGGAFDFVGGNSRAVTDTGGFWTVRALFGSRSIISVEAIYLGTAQGLQSLGLGLENNARLISNGGQGTIRFNAPIGIHKMLIEPYGFAGGGWQHYSVVNTNTFSASIRSTDNVVLLPVGAGLAFGYNGLLVDIRGQYQFSYQNDLLGSTGLDNWNAGGTVGFEF